jgi:Arc/MetJ-type ribon-helix-helix transcriptional regulator
MNHTGYDFGVNLNLLLSDELTERIEDFWHAHRFGSRSEAIRWLLQAALDANLKPEKAEAKRS